MREKKFLSGILFSIILNRLCSLVPSGIYFDPFPLWDIMYEGENVGISLQMYLYIFSQHALIISIWLLLSQNIDKYNLLFRAFLFIELASLADFFIIYEHPWFHFIWDIEFTDFKIVLYAYFIILWNNGKLSPGSYSRYSDI